MPQAYQFRYRRSVARFCARPQATSTRWLTHPVIRRATIDDLPAVLALYQELHPSEDAPSDAREVFTHIVNHDGLSILLLDVDGTPVATTYLNVIPNLTRGAAPYAIIENVVVAQRWRGQGLGKRIMAATLQEAWNAGCYKAMLLTGSKTPSTHAYYRACGFDPAAKQAYLARPPADNEDP